MRQNKLSVYMHFVWATWDRLPLVTPGIEQRLYRHIQATCQRHGCAVLALNGMPDHVHLLVQFSNTISIGDLMEFVKGSSSRFVNARLRPETLFRWEGSYGSFSVSARDCPAVMRYIENQKQHHADGSIWPNAERSDFRIDDLAPSAHDPQLLS